jgi:hypothetical protein
MSALEIAAVVAVSAWLAAVTVVVAALARQIALLESRLVFAGSVGDTGLGVGTLIPKELRELTPQLWQGLSYVLFTSPTCGPCVDLVENLDRAAVGDARLLAPVTADDDMTKDFVELFPPAIEVIRDPAATRLFELLAVGTTPFVIEIEGGVVTGKAYVRGVEDLNNLITARESSDASQVYEGRKGVVLT